MHSSLKRALSGLETRPFLINISTSLVVIGKYKGYQTGSVIDRPAFSLFIG